MKTLTIISILFLFKNINGEKILQQSSLSLLKIVETCSANYKRYEDQLKNGYQEYNKAKAEKKPFVDTSFDADSQSLYWDAKWRGDISLIKDYKEKTAKWARITEIDQDAKLYNDEIKPHDV